ncbi:MAG: hemin uptake protein HemP [Kiloniellales bacterium]|nr:hemin uptake protein HemP [Kiloniellales bacterium]
MTGRRVAPKDAKALVPFASSAGEDGRTATAERSIASVELFAGAKVVIIEHAGERYRLRRTSKGKLILTK